MGCGDAYFHHWRCTTGAYGLAGIIVTLRTRPGTSWPSLVSRRPIAAGVILCHAVPFVIRSKFRSTLMKPGETVSLTPGKRVLFLTKDPQTIRKQLRGELDLRMEELCVEDLMDAINTDAMAPAWACFDYRPEDIARNAYAGITVNGERLFPEGSLMDGGFEVIVSGQRKGVGSSREAAVQAEKWSGIRIAIAASFAPIHARNNISQGVLMGDHAVLTRLQRGEQVPLEEFEKGYDVITRKIVEHGGLFPFTQAYARGAVSLPAPATAARPMNMAEKILAAHVAGA